MICWLRYLPTLLFTLILCTCDRARTETATVTPAHPAVQAHEWPRDRKTRVIIDSDTANEIDDLYAIAYALADTTIELLGLSSAQWFHRYSGDATVQRSQQLNEELLAVAGHPELPQPLGTDSIMGQPWGGYEARDSPAARFIIEQAHATPSGEKLAVISIGAVTNLASAMALDPTITHKIVSYNLGFQYSTQSGHWDKNEFNIRTDLNAADFLLNNEALEMHIMPASVSQPYTWPRTSTFEHLAEAGDLGHYLRTRWEEYAGPDATEWTMWDVALIQAFLHPRLANERAVLPPPENTQRYVWIYDSIDEERMTEDYWQRMKQAY